MREIWKGLGPLLLAIIMWTFLLGDEWMFGEVYAQGISSVVIGVCSLLFITTQQVVVYGSTFWWVLGLLNIALGIGALMTI